MHYQPLFNMCSGQKLAKLKMLKMYQNIFSLLNFVHFKPLFNITPGRWQSKTLSTINERGSKIDRNSVFDCFLSPLWRQMEIKNCVSIGFFFLSKFLDTIGALDCRLPGMNECSG